MSEIINNSKIRVSTLKKLIREMHQGAEVEATRVKLEQMLGTVPYGEVVQAEQELMNEGFTAEEILQYCDMHSAAMKGNIDHSATKKILPGHPIDTFELENTAVSERLRDLRLLRNELTTEPGTERLQQIVFKLQAVFHQLMDLDKHYLRKENLVFPFLEKYEITGPPAVMWGKHDEIRGFLKSSISTLEDTKDFSADDLLALFNLFYDKTLVLIEEMIYKEENILHPMCADTFNEMDWFEIYQQSDEIGYCLTEPQAIWKPETDLQLPEKAPETGLVRLSTGSFSLTELETLFSVLPCDLTFVDKDDIVKYYSHGKDRIFERNKAVLGRKVHYCHPPSSVHIVDKILTDFKAGTQNEAKFWINLKGKFVHIAYYAVRNAGGEYLGTLEVTQDIQPYKTTEGERRLLTYEN